MAATTVNTSKVQAINWKIDFQKLDAYAKKVDRSIPDVVAAIGFAIQAKAAQIAPRDTGALVNSIYVRTFDSNPLPSVTTEANRVQLPRPENNKNVIVGPSVEYGLYVEMGTRSMGPRPYLAPAVRQTKAQFDRELRRVFGK